MDREQERICRFLAQAFPIVARHVRALLGSHGLKVKEECPGPELAFTIKTGQGEVQFFLENLLLEIATIDRDERPLRFDERVLDLDFFARKSARLINSKLRILLCLVREHDFDGGLARVKAMAKDYERVRIWRFDTDGDKDPEARPE